MNTGLSVCFLQFLGVILRDCELVLLIGNIGKDHLERIFIDRPDKVSCLRDSCEKKSIVGIAIYLVRNTYRFSN